MRKFIPPDLRDFENLRIVSQIRPPLPHVDLSCLLRLRHLTFVEEENESFVFWNYVLHWKELVEDASTGQLYHRGTECFMMFGCWALPLQEAKEEMRRARGVEATAVDLLSVSVEWARLAVSAGTQGSHAAPDYWILTLWNDGDFVLRYNREGQWYRLKQQHIPEYVEVVERRYRPRYRPQPQGDIQGVACQHVHWGYDSDATTVA